MGKVKFFSYERGSTSSLSRSTEGRSGKTRSINPMSAADSTVPDNGGRILATSIEYTYTTTAEVKKTITLRSQAVLGLINKSTKLEVNPTTKAVASKCK